MIYAEKFDSLSQMIDELRTRPQAEAMRGASSSETSSSGFTETANYNEAVELALNGYTKPLEAIKRGLIEAETNGVAPRRCRIVNDIVGYVPNVPAAVIGLPQSMVRSDIEAKKSKIISLVHSPDANACTSAKTIEKAGIAVLTIVNNLEKCGYRVALSIAFFVGKDGDTTLCGMVNVKDWRQPLDLKKVAFPICHPSMLRRLGFKWLETCKEATSGFSHGYGRTPSYGEARKALETAKQMNEKQYFINVELCEKHRFDPEKIAAACGIQKVR